MKHISVLLEESIESLNLKETSIVVDATLGLGGHSYEILKIINKGFLYCFDQDDTSIKIAKDRLKDFKNFEIIRSNFVDLENELKKRNVLKVDSILFDLGVSSPQLDEAERGFSFHQDAVLDMRMDQSAELTAKDVVNKYSFEKLKKIITEYGDEKYAKNIARAIEKNREKKEIKTTFELVEIIQSCVPEKYKREKHPARKTFQAIRIEVNNELEVLSSALKQSLELLNINGRLCVITFHSLEDKICQNIFKEVSEMDIALKKMPIVPENMKPKFKIIKKISPSKKELEDNNRARSAKLRIIERVR